MLAHLPQRNAENGAPGWLMPWPRLAFQSDVVLREFLFSRVQSHRPRKGGPRGLVMNTSRTARLDRAAALGHTSWPNCLRHYPVGDEAQCRPRVHAGPTV